MKKWGFYQKECHRLLIVVFISKAPAYKWLYQTFGVKHFADLKRYKKEDQQKLKEIYEALYVLQFKIK